MSKWLAPVPSWPEELSNHLQECGLSHTSVTMVRCGKTVHNQVCSRVCHPISETVALFSILLPSQLGRIWNVAAYGFLPACVFRFPFLDGGKKIYALLSKVCLYLATLWCSHMDRPHLKPVGVKHNVDLNLNNLDKMINGSSCKIRT